MDSFTLSLPYLISPNNNISDCHNSLTSQTLTPLQSTLCAYTNTVLRTKTEPNGSTAAQAQTTFPHGRCQCQQELKSNTEAQPLGVSITPVNTSDLTVCVRVSWFLLAVLFPPIQPYHISGTKQTRAQRRTGSSWGCVAIVYIQLSCLQIKINAQCLGCRMKQQHWATVPLLQYTSCVNTFVESSHKTCHKKISFSKCSKWLWCVNLHKSIFTFFSTCCFTQVKIIFLT